MSIKILLPVILSISCNNNVAVDKIGDASTYTVSIQDSSGLERTTARIGTLLTCSHSGNDATAKRVTYSWSGISSENATSTYTVVEADDGKEITCSVSYVNADGNEFEGTSAPVVVSNLANTSCPNDLTDRFASGSGTEADPYVICNGSQFGLITDNLSAYYELGSDISLSEFNTQTTALGTGFIPIGLQKDALANASTFTGSLDGNGFKITDGTIRFTGTNYASLIARTSNATIKNIEFVRIDIAGHNARKLSNDASNDTNTAIIGYSESSNYADVTVSDSRFQGGGNVGMIT